jgi:cytochrome c551/c552
VWPISNGENEYAVEHKKSRRPYLRLLVASALAVTGSRPANATPAYAQQTGKACGFCHVNPAGGGKLKPAGEKFKANGHKL